MGFPGQCQHQPRPIPGGLCRRPDQSLHTERTAHQLRPAGRSGSLALSRLSNGQPQVLDYLNYTTLPPDWSYGSLPDGQSFVRQVFYPPTPGATNNGTGVPPPSFIAYN